MKTAILRSRFGYRLKAVLFLGTLSSPISVGGNPTSVIFSPDGSKAYVANQGLKGSGYYVSIIDTATNTRSRVINVPYPIGGMAFSPDGTKLYLTTITASFHSGVTVIDATNNTVDETFVLRADRRQPGQPAITPDGKFLYVPLLLGRIKSNNNQVLMVRTVDNKVGAHIVVGMEPVAAAITPNGNYAYVSNYLDGTVSVIDITPR